MKRISAKSILKLTTLLSTAVSGILAIPFCYLFVVDNRGYDTILLALLSASYLGLASITNVIGRYPKIFPERESPKKYAGNNAGTTPFMAKLCNLFFNIGFAFASAIAMYAIAIMVAVDLEKQRILSISVLHVFLDIFGMGASAFSLVALAIAIDEYQKDLNKDWRDKMFGLRKRDETSEPG